MYEVAKVGRLPCVMFCDDYELLILWESGVRLGWYSLHDIRVTNWLSNVILGACLESSLEENIVLQSAVFALFSLSHFSCQFIGSSGVV